jgi:hypothetical protein
MPAGFTKRIACFVDCVDGLAVLRLRPMRGFL